MASDDVIDRLLQQLNTSRTCQDDKGLNQVIKQLIQELKKLSVTVSGGGSGGGGGSSVVNNITNLTQIMNPLGNSLLYGNDGFNRNISSGENSTPVVDSDDYVVLSDGGIPTPEPVNDGAGNFIYIAYTP